MTRKQRRDRRKKILTNSQKNRMRNKLVKKITSALVDGHVDHRYKEFFDLSQLDLYDRILGRK